MKFLNIKLRRDIVRHWTQFFSVFLMALLSVLLFTGLQGGWRGLEVSLDSFIETSKLPDAWIFSLGFTQSDIQEVENIPGIESVVEKTRVSATVQNDQNQYIWLDTYNTLSSIPYVVEGEEISTITTTHNGIWLNKEYASENQLTVGETMQVRLGEIEVELDVLGIIQSADRICFTGSYDFIAPNYSQYGYGWISEKTLRESFGYQWPHNMLEIRGSNETLRERMEVILEDRHAGFYDRNTLLDISEPLGRVEQIRNLSFLFSAIFMVLAMLAMYTTISRLIETQTKEIAVLKAIGISNKRIGLHYGSYGLLIGGAGAIFGGIISPLMSWFVISTQQSILSIPKWEIAYTISSLFVIIFVISVCTLSAFLASKAAIYCLPAFFLRGIKKKGRKIILENTKVWDKIKFENRWVIRDAVINRSRFIMGVIGVIGSMMLLMTGFGMPSSMHNMINRMYNNELTHDMAIEFDIGSYDKVKDNYKGQWLQVTPARITPDDGHDRLLSIFDEGDYFHLQTEDGEELQEGNVYISRGFANRAGLSKGDEITIKPSLDNNEYTFIIADILKREVNQGIFIGRQTWENAGGQFSPRILLMSDNDFLSPSEADPNIISITKVSEQEKNALDFLASFMGVFI